MYNTDNIKQKVMNDKKAQYVMKPQEKGICLWDLEGTAEEVTFALNMAKV